jgi:hypothetical protein
MEVAVGVAAAVGAGAGKATVALLWGRRERRTMVSRNGSLYSFRKKEKDTKREV